MNRRLCALGALTAVAAMTAGSGCQRNSRPATAPVSGHVTYQGKPVTMGRIVFQAERGRPAVGTIGPDGSYQLTTFDPGDGAIPGRYRVTIRAVRNIGPQPKSPEDETRPGFGPGEMEWLVPELYSRLDSTPLTAEVKPGPNHIDFDLPRTR